MFEFKICKAHEDSDFFTFNSHSNLVIVVLFYDLAATNYPVICDLCHCWGNPRINKENSQRDGNWEFPSGISIGITPRDFSKKDFFRRVFT